MLENKLLSICDVFSLYKNITHAYGLEALFTMQTEKENANKQGKFTTTVYRKLTFSEVYSNSDSFLPSVYKFDMVYTLVYRCFSICSNWAQFHTE